VTRLGDFSPFERLFTGGGGSFLKTYKNYTLAFFQKNKLRIHFVALCGHTFWAIFSQVHLVTLIFDHLSAKKN
jgi:hypothetical protein